MAFESNEYGRSEAANGLLIPNQPTTVLTGIMQEDVPLEGGFPLWGKLGEGDKCWATKPESDSFFKGIAQRITIRDEYYKADNVSIVAKGAIWVKVAETVKSGQEAKISEEGKIGVTGTAIPDARFLTDSNADSLAVLMLG